MDWIALGFCPSTLILVCPPVSLLVRQGPSGPLGFFKLLQPTLVFLLPSRRIPDAPGVLLCAPGVLSVALICLSGFTVGMVLGLQLYTTLTRFGAEEGLGAVVGLSLVRELGPVVAGLLVTGRAGSAITAEIGAMKATEQLDGLRMMAINPIH